MVKKVKWKSSVKPEDNYIVRKEKEFLDRQSEAKYKYQKKNQTSKSASVNKLAQLLFPMANPNVVRRSNRIKKRYVPQRQVQQIPQRQYQQSQQIPFQYLQQQPREVVPAFKSSGGKPYQAVNKRPLTPSNQTMQYGVVEVVDSFSGKRYFKRLPQAETWIKPK